MTDNQNISILAKWMQEEQKIMQDIETRIEERNCKMNEIFIKLNVLKNDNQLKIDFSSEIMNLIDEYNNLETQLTSLKNDFDKHRRLVDTIESKIQYLKLLNC